MASTWMPRLRADVKARFSPPSGDKVAVLSAQMLKTRTQCSWAPAIMIGRVERERQEMHSTAPVDFNHQQRSSQADA